MRPPVMVLLAIALGGCAHRAATPGDAEPVRETPLGEKTGTTAAGRPAVPRPPHTLYRSEIERALGPGPGYLLGQLGPEPYRPDGKFVGWRITRVFPDDPELCNEACDLRVDDVILAVDGNRLETPQALSEAVASVADARELTLERLRGGAHERVVFAILED